LIIHESGFPMIKENGKIGSSLGQLGIWLGWGGMRWASLTWIIEAGVSDEEVSMNDLAFP
jgi:hypothetical protein